MNIGPMLVLIKLFQDAKGVSIIGPPAPNGETPTEIKPTCGPGKYAKFNTSTDRWTCEVIPKGR